MKDTLVHARTREQLQKYIKQPSHAILVMGSNGIGKTYLAKLMLASILNLEQDALDRYPYFLPLNPDGGSISIDAVRELRHFVQLKAPGSKSLRRGIIIEHAEKLTIEAQNALLKVLEEPPDDTVLVLTVDSQHSLLPTIISRLQTITVYIPNENDVKQFFKDKTKQPAMLEQAYFLSGGLPGLMAALLNDDATHPLLTGVTTAKEVLQKPLFERLAMVDALSKQKEESLYLLEALQHIAETGITQAATRKDAQRLKQWHRILKVSTEAFNALNGMANPKLTLTNLMLRI